MKRCFGVTEFIVTVQSKAKARTQDNEEESETKNTVVDDEVKKKKQPCTFLLMKFLKIQGSVWQHCDFEILSNRFVS